MKTRDALPTIQRATFTTRDIGYGEECGEITLPALGPPLWTGARPYRSEPCGEIVYLFDDEIDNEP